MFGLLSSAALSLMASHASATVNVYGPKACSGVDCRLIRPAVPFDCYHNGTFSSKYRACIDKRRSVFFCDKVAEVCSLDTCDMIRERCVSFLHNSCLPKKRDFILCVEKTMTETCKKFNYNKKCNDKFLEKVLCAIYSAASASQASLFDLVVFTSIAMHNHNVFYSFVDVNDTNNEVDRERGLLRIKSEKYYEMCTGLVSGDKTNYTRERYALNRFDEVSIRVEFALYMKAFRPAFNSCFSSWAYAGVIEEMASDEGAALAGKVAFTSELLKKLERRTFIFVTMSKLIVRIEN
ncbi:hypothetical protein PAPHI01_0164 [Pancytospora philotis]|nr:hypothetical protein PAPHI01_0164 [Pancytospora philotis]